MRLFKKYSKLGVNKEFPIEIGDTVLIDNTEYIVVEDPKDGWITCNVSAKQELSNLLFHENDVEDILYCEYYQWTSLPDFLREARYGEDSN